MLSCRLRNELFENSANFEQSTRPEDGNLTLYGTCICVSNIRSYSRHFDMAHFAAHCEWILCVPVLACSGLETHSYFDSSIAQVSPMYETIEKRERRESQSEIERDSILFL